MPDQRLCDRAVLCDADKVVAAHKRSWGGEKTWFTGPRTSTGRLEVDRMLWFLGAGLLFMGEEENQRKDVNIFRLGFFLFFLYHTIYPFTSPGRGKTLGIRDASGPAEIPGLPTFDQVRFSDKRPGH